MSSLVEVQRIIGLSLNKIQMGRNQRGGLPLHKNLLVATVLNKARDAYMQETMYMNYRLMACGQFAAHQEDLEEEDTPEPEDYEEDSESDVEDDNTTTAAAALTAESVAAVDNTTSSSSAKEYSVSSTLLAMAGTLASSKVAGRLEEEEVVASTTTTTSVPLLLAALPVKSNIDSSCSIALDNNSSAIVNNDEGFIDDSSDCDCDARNFCQDSGENNRVPFQYCFNCAPFHPSNGRGPTLVSPQGQQHHQHHHQPLPAAVAAVVTTTATQLTAPTMTTGYHQLTAEGSSGGGGSQMGVLTPGGGGEAEDKLLIYDMDSGLAMRNSRLQSQQQQLGRPGLAKRKRHISVEETEEAVNSILGMKRRRDGAGGESFSSAAGGGEEESGGGSDCLDDSGFQEENEIFHPAFRGMTGSPHGMEVDQITSLVSIFSFGQQLFKNSEAALVAAVAAQTGQQQQQQPISPDKEATADNNSSSAAADDDSDSDSDTSSDSGHSSDDNEKNSEDKSEVCCGGGGGEAPDLTQTCAAGGCDLTVVVEAVGGLGVAAAV